MKENNVKFPKILHLPWSEGVDEKTDKIMSEDDVLVNFSLKDVVATEKLDGENTTMYPDHIHARSINSKRHPSRSKVKLLHSLVKMHIPSGWRVCGENVSAEHSIHYSGLLSCFYVFAIYDETGECLAWDETEDWASLLHLQTVPVLFLGRYDEDKIRECYTGKSRFHGCNQEGYVMRMSSSIPWDRHSSSFAKFVRRGHVQTDEHWMHGPVKWNDIEEGLL